MVEEDWVAISVKEGVKERFTQAKIKFQAKVGQVLTDGEFLDLLVDGTLPKRVKE